MSRNPYHRARPPQVHASVFAFLDILGYKEMALRSSGAGANAQLASLHSALSAARKHLADDPIGSGPHDRFVIKAFTDNIVIGWPVLTDAESEFGDAFFRLANFQMSLLLSGYFVRGAISVGPAFIDDIAVFGDALNEAYEGESKLARDPRLLLTESAVEVTKHHLSYYAPPANAPHVRCVLHDYDDQWFLDYLGCAQAETTEAGGTFDSTMAQHKAAVETQLHRHQNTLPVWTKFAWAARYHNFFCAAHRYPHLLIPTALFSTASSLGNPKPIA
jgi:hypothetical protein